MKKGFTLIETIIAVALLSILIISVSALNAVTIRMAKFTSERDKSYNIAKGVCEMYASDADTYSIPGSDLRVYKYINGLDDISDIQSIISNRDGLYQPSDIDTIISSGTGKEYTLILDIHTRADPPQLEIFNASVIKNDSKIRVTLIRIK